MFPNAPIRNENFRLPDMDSASAVWLRNIESQNYKHGILTNRVTMDNQDEDNIGTYYR